MKRLSRQFTLLFLICSAILSFRLAVPIAAIPQNTPSKAVRNVLVVTMDGMRWQEVFAGMTADLLTPKDGGVSESAKKKVEERFGGATAEERRAKVLPFIWTTIAKTGQVFGDPSKGSDARVTNGLRFSYPGYNEILSGFPDSRIDSNDRKPNPNVTMPITKMNIDTNTTGMDRMRKSIRNATTRRDTTPSKSSGLVAGS